MFDGRIETSLFVLYTTDSFRIGVKLIFHEKLGITLLASYSLTFCLDTKSNKKVKASEKLFEILRDVILPRAKVARDCSNALIKLATNRTLRTPERRPLISN